MRQGVRLSGIKIVRKPSGKRYMYHRASGARLPDLPENDPTFLAAYAAAASAPTKSRGAGQGTIAALCDEYIKSRDMAALGSSSRAVRRRLVAKIRDARGFGRLSDLRPDHIRRDVRALTPGAASNRLKTWRGLFCFAVDEGLIQPDPSRDVRAPKSTTIGHRQWTTTEIDAFRAYWPDRSAQRIAMEIIYWTGARCVDAAKLGRQLVDKSGWLSFVQIKTGGPVTLPLTCDLPAWAAPLSDDQAHLWRNLPTDMHWITTAQGRPRSHKALSQWFSRSASAAALAESGASTHQIGAWTGHASLSEVSHYPRQADLRAILTGPEQKRNIRNRIAKFPNPPRKYL